MNYKYNAAIVHSNNVEKHLNELGRHGYRVVSILPHLSESCVGTQFYIVMELKEEF